MEIVKYNLEYIDLDLYPELKSIVKDLNGTIKTTPIKGNMNAIRGKVTLTDSSFAAIVPTLRKFKSFCQEKRIIINSVN
jgi:hypothetical protein